MPLCIGMCVRHTCVLVAIHHPCCVHLEISVLILSAVCKYIVLCTLPTWYHVGYARCIITNIIVLVGRLPCFVVVWYNVLFFGCLRD